MRIAVLFGGESEERDVSIASATEAIAALRTRGHDVLAVDTAVGALSRAEESAVLTSAVRIAPPIESELEAFRRADATLRIPGEVTNVDVVFLALHGGAGEDGRLQAVLELAGIPYTGSGPLSSGLAMDKDIAKTLLRAAGIDTPDWIIAPVDAAEAIATLGLPLVVKPTAQGSTVGLSVVRSADRLAPAIAHASRYGTVMIERFIRGRELTVGVLDDESDTPRALTVGEILVDQDEAFSYADKYQADAVTEVFPATLPDDVAEQVRHDALEAHRRLRLTSYSRSDFRLDDDGHLFHIEVNTLPGLTRTSLLPQSAAASGIDYATLCERLCKSALRRSTNDTRP